MGRQDEPIEAATATLQQQVARTVEGLEGRAPGTQGYNEAATDLFSAVDDLLKHEKRVPELEARRRRAHLIGVSRWASGLAALWSLLLIATVPLGWTGQAWLLLLIPMAMADLVAWIFAEDSVRLRTDVGVPAFAAAGLGALLLVTHLAPAWILAGPVVMVSALALWALGPDGKGTNRSAGEVEL